MSEKLFLVPLRQYEHHMDWPTCQQWSKLSLKKSSYDFLKHVIAYIDNIFIYSQNMRHHIQHARTGLSNLQHHQPLHQEKTERCEFHTAVKLSCHQRTHSWTIPALTSSTMNMLPSLWQLNERPTQLQGIQPPVVINQFSKAYWLLQLKGLPTAMETANTLFYYVFRV